MGVGVCKGRCRGEEVVEGVVWAVVGKIKCNV